MALVVYDRVQEITATTGTGSLTLGGAVAAYQSFSVIGNGNTTYYTILNGAQWEVGIGTYSTTGPTLARTTVLSNSNGNTSPITLVGASTVWCDYPAEKAIYYDANGVATIGTTLGYSDTGIIASFTSGVAGYNQVILQNKTAASNASSNFNVSNDAGTAGANYAEFGINSSIFSNGSGAFNLPGASYLASASTDLAIGTYGAYPIHFVTNSSTIDAMTIYSTGGASLGGLGDPGIGNIAINNAVVGFTAITSAVGTTVLTNSATQIQAVTGTLTQTIQLPQATTLLKGTFYTISNMSTGLVTVKDNAGTTLETITTGGAVQFLCASNLTSAGTWGIRVFASSNTTWGNTALNYTGNITGATWQGNTVQSGYGGTGLTTFTAANYALYSTSASALTAGTLPPAAGGTGITSLTVNYIPYGNGSSAWQSSSSLQFNGTYLLVGASAVLGGLTNPIIASTGSANNYVQSYIYNSTNGVSSSADFVAYPSNGADTHGWVDMGITSLAYADTTYTVTGPNEAYLFGSAPSSSGTSGNLVFATDNTGSTNAFQWYVGGFTQAKSAYKMQLSSTALTLAGNLTFNATGQRITGDFSNATASSRVAFQSSTANGNTNILVIPNGTSTTSAINLSNASDPTNAQSLTLSSLSTDTRINSGAFGTGTYLPLTMYTGGSERLRIDTSGNVGIGTASPATRLQVTDNTSQGTIQLGGTATTGYYSQINQTANALNIIANGDQAYRTSLATNNGSGYITFQTANLTVGNTERMRIDAAGNVGIGTSSPSTYGLLVVNNSATSGTSTDNTISYIRSANRNAILSLDSYSGNTSSVYAYQNGSLAGSIAFWGSTSANPNSITFNGKGSNTEVMRIDSSGNVGINCTPAYKLSIVGASEMSRISSTSTDGFIRIAETSGDVILGSTSAVGFVGTSTSTPFTIRTSNTERMRIDAAGVVGIGTTTPSSLATGLAIVSGTTVGANLNLSIGPAGGSLGKDSRITFGSTFSNNWAGTDYGTRYSGAIEYGANGGDTTPRSWSMRFLTGTSTIDTPTERMRIDNAGNVGIGVTNPGYTLDVLATSGSPAIQMRGRASDNLSALLFNNNTGNAGSNVSYIQGAASATGYLAFGTANTGRMNIDYSGNIQIGASATAPNTSRYLDIYNTDTGTGSVDLRLITENVANTGSAVVDIIKYHNGAFNINNNETNSAAYTSFGVGASERMRIDSSGNVGVGVTTLPWYSAITAITSKSMAIWSNNITQAIAGNVYRTTSGYTPTYIATSYAAEIEFNGGGSGGIQFNVAPSGTSGTTATLTQAMTLFVSGGLSLGNTTDPGATNLSVTGTVKSPYLQGPTFSAYQSTQQTIATATLTKVQLQSKEFDTNSNFDNTTNYRFTPTVAGYYKVSGQVNFSGGFAIQNIFATIYKNGTEFKRGTRVSCVAGTAVGVVVSALVSFNGSTDYIELYTYQDSGSSLALEFASPHNQENYFQAVFIRTL